MKLETSLFPTFNVYHVSLLFLTPLKIEREEKHRSVRFAKNRIEVGIFCLSSDKTVCKTEIFHVSTHIFRIYIPRRSRCHKFSSTFSHKYKFLMTFLLYYVQTLWSTHKSLMKQKNIFFGKKIAFRRPFLISIQEVSLLHHDGNTLKVLSPGRRH